MDTMIKITPERFGEGFTVDEFIETLGRNRETFEENYNTFTLKPEDAVQLQELGRPLKVLVLAEDWCGDVLRYLPAFTRMCEAAGDWDVRVFPRDKNPDLADLWLKEGKYRSIPVMVFFDENLREIACFVEKPTAVYGYDSRAREGFAAQHTHLEDASSPPSEMSQETYNLYTEYIRSQRTASRKQWQQLFVDEIKGKLLDAQI